jgi:transposase
MGWIDWLARTTVVELFIDAPLLARFGAWCGTGETVWDSEREGRRGVIFGGNDRSQIKSYPTLGHRISSRLFTNLRRTELEKIKSLPCTLRVVQKTTQAQAPIKMEMVIRLLQTRKGYF